MRTIYSLRLYFDCYWNPATLCMNLQIDSSNYNSVFQSLFKNRENIIH